MALTYRWDPTLSDDWKLSRPSSMCLKRIQKELMNFQGKASANIYVTADERDMTVVHALVVGPVGSPYEGGFFYFLVRLPPDYPIRPPRVKLMTTAGNTVRFNPTLYRNGKVCLSIIGTQRVGQKWYPALQLLDVLISIQAMMCEEPYFNRRFVTKERRVGDSRRYNEIISHETIRIAVCDMLEGTTCNSRDMPAELRRHAEKVFLEKYQHYLEVCDGNAALQGTTMKDPYFRMNSGGKFDYKELKKRLQVIRDTVVVKKKASGA